MASPTVIDAAWTFDNRNTAQNGRFVIGSLFQDAASSTAANSAWRDGVIPGPYSTSLSKYRSLHVTENSPTGSSVLVQPGHAVVTRTAQGMYLCPNSAPRVVALDPADATNPRIDLIVLQVLDTALGDASTDVQIRAVTGTPAGSPVAPALPTGAIELARVAVAAAPTGNTIVNANITDRRKSAGIKGTVRQLLALDAVSDAGVHGDLRDNGGLLERYNASSSRWVSVAHNTVAWGRRTTASSSSTGSTVGVLRLDNIPVKAGRDYIILTGPLHPAGSQDGDNARIEILYSTTGTATTSDALLPDARVFERIGNPFGGTTVIRARYTPGADQTLSVLLCITRNNGSGSISLTADGNRNTYMEVIDAGPSIANSGVAV